MKTTDMSKNSTEKDFNLKASKILDLKFDLF